MPILDLQMRARELGRIRIGQVVTADSGKTRPAKLDRFRITAHSRELIAKIATLYGGDVAEWQPQGGGPVGWEVVTTSTRLPILVPPQPVSQWYETWSGGGCARRCDGVREMLSDKPCLCGPDPAERVCKPTTRLNVVLREVEGVGVFRLETHGYYAAVELPSAAGLLAAAGGYIAGYLGLEERVVKRDGKTRRFMVPTLDIDITPAQLMAGVGSSAALGQAQTPAAPPAREQAAIPAVAAASDRKVSDDELEILMQQIRDVSTLAQLSELSRGIAANFDVDPAGPIPDAFRKRAKDLTVVHNGFAASVADDLWAQIMSTVPAEWTSKEVENDFEVITGVPADQADGVAMNAYLAARKEIVADTAQ